ncbi:MAG: SH3 domain-containing protein [Saprospiraceae bacterium]|nr:MAG: SH3 type 3 domain-containing protein [Bacteroidetes bacterium OLB9]MCO6463154.1 SH3 domain-containing protein [Saprospiraceae bacterium]
MRKYRLIILFVWISVSLFAGSIEDDMKKAAKAIQNKDYTTALKVYQMLEETGYASVGLYQNMAICQSALQQEINALVSVEKGLLYKPEDYELLKIRENILKDHPEIDAHLQSSGFIKLWKKFASLLLPTGWSVLSLIVLIVVGMITIKLYPEWGQNSKLKLFGGILGAIFILFVITGIYRNHQLYHSNTAIVASKQTLLLLGPDKQSPILDTLIAGNKVYKTDHIGQWWNVQTAFGERGWIQSENAVMIR